jgi:hypothetical protein
MSMTQVVVSRPKLSLKFNTEPVALTKIKADLAAQEEAKAADIERERQTERAKYVERLEARRARRLVEVERENKRIAMSARRALVAKFPLCFAPAGAPKQPLKIGISKDLEAFASAELPYWQIILAVRDYTRGESYLLSCALGAVRVGLDGEPAGIVDASGVACATGQLKALAKAREQRAALHLPVQTCIVPDKQEACQV